MEPTIEPTIESSYDAVIVTDNRAAFVDLSNGSDLDVETNRQLVIRWSFDSAAQDYHVYVQVDGGEYRYLGRPASGMATFYEWRPDEDWSSSHFWIHENFKDGPQFGHTYSFMVFAMNEPGHFSRPVSTSSAVTYDSGDDGEPIAEDLQPNTSIVTDHSASFTDLSGGSDEDTKNNRCLTIRWRYDWIQALDYHIYVRIDGNKPQYLGRPGHGSLDSFDWRPGQLWISDPNLKDGPQFGHTYAFDVYIMDTSGKFHGPYRTVDAVRYTSGDDSDPVPTDMQRNTASVTDDLLTWTDLGGGEDHDTEDNRCLVIRWRTDRTDGVDCHVYVQVDGAEPHYLGRSGNGAIEYYEWRIGQRWLHERFVGGPVFGNRYQFHIRVLTEAGTFLPPMYTGEVEYLFEQEAVGKWFSPGPPE